MGWPARAACAALTLAAGSGPLEAQVAGGRWQRFHDYGPESNGSFYGSPLVRLGDISGDGVDDFAVAMPQSSGLHFRQGSVFLYSGATGQLLRPVHGDDDDSHLGMALGAAGDFNGDQVPDFLAGAPYRGSGLSGAERGAVYAFSGADGARLHRLNGGVVYDHFGFAVSGLGDVDGDGVPDFAGGAPDADPAGLGAAGRLTIHSGASGALLLTIDGAAAGARLGAAITAAPDLDGDGHEDVVVGAPGAAGPAGAAGGRVQVFSSRTGALLREWIGDEAGMGLGTVLANVGDLNGDGWPEIAAGAPATDGAAGPASGAAWILDLPTGTVHAVLPGAAGFERFGAAFAGAGDVDQDGANDLFIGAPGAASAGRAELRYGPDFSVADHFTGLFDGCGAGSALAILPDRNGDGSEDLLIGAPFTQGGQGRAYAYEVTPLLRMQPGTMSVNAGGLVRLSVDFGAPYGSLPYVILASTQVGETLLGGVLVPLARDRFLTRLLAGTTHPALIGFAGVLSSQGQTGAGIALQPGQLPPSWIGRTLQFAAVAHDGAGSGVIATRPVALRFVP